MITELPLILDISDSGASRNSRKRSLASAGYFVLECSTALDGLRLAREREPAVLILDVRLSDLDGFEVCRRLKADPATSSIAVLLISAEFLDQARQNAGLECGSDLFLFQPVSPKELVSSVRALARVHYAWQKAQRLSHQWNITFEAMNCGIALLDAYGIVRQCNGVMAKLLGRTPDGMAGVEIFSLLRDSIGLDGWDTMTQMNRHEATEIFSSGQWFSLEFKPLDEKPGRPYGAFCILSCITDRKKVEHTLRQANQMLVEADRRKNQILAMVAHELREPLAPIRYAQQIINQTSSKRGRIKRQQAIIDRQLSTMSRLLEDLLDITRIREGKLSLSRKILDLQPVVDQVVEALRPQFADRCHKLVYEPSSSPLWLAGDEIRLEQIVRNLLANAIKFTEPGGWIELRLEREDSPDLAKDQAQSWAVLRVRDSGIGIAPEMLPHIFDQFCQADLASEFAQGGLGIGLALVRSLAQMHGGQVLARSEGIGKGSEFILRLPLSSESRFPVTFPPGEVPTETVHAQKEERLKILIVDDSPDTVEALEELLHLWGYEVQGAHGGGEAIAEAQAFQPDVILLDLGLPGMNGHEVCRRLRQEPSLEGVLVIAVTGYGRDEDRSMAQESGFDHLLVKPVNLAQLRKIIAQAAMLRD